MPLIPQCWRNGISLTNVVFSRPVELGGAHKLVLRPGMVGRPERAIPMQTETRPDQRTRVCRDCGAHIIYLATPDNLTIKVDAAGVLPYEGVMNWLWHTAHNCTRSQSAFPITEYGSSLRRQQIR